MGGEEGLIVEHSLCGWTVSPSFKWDIGLLQTWRWGLRDSVSGLFVNACVEHAAFPCLHTYYK